MIHHSFHLTILKGCSFKSVKTIVFIRRCPDKQDFCIGKNSNRFIS